MWSRKHDEAAPGPHGGAYRSFPSGPADFQESNRPKTLDLLFHAAVCHAEDRIAWYGGKGRRMAWNAQALRISALILFGAGTLAPLVQTVLLKIGTIAPPVANASEQSVVLANWSFWSSLPAAEIGYVLLGLAGGIIAFDQFFGRSASWMRFRQTEARMQSLLADLRFSWVQHLAATDGISLDPASASAMIKLLRDFVARIELVAEEETKSWAEQFRSRIEAFDSNPALKVPTPGRKPDERQVEPQGPAAADEWRVPPGDLLPAGDPTASKLAAMPIVPVATAAYHVVVGSPHPLDPESLMLMVDGAGVKLQDNGRFDLPLLVGATCQIVATGRSDGVPLRAEVQVTPRADDDGRVLELSLA